MVESLTKDDCDEWFEELTCLTVVDKGFSFWSDFIIKFVLSIIIKLSQYLCC